MLAPEKLQTLQSLTTGASAEELNWMHGFLSGLLQGNAPAPVAPPAGKITITFGTESGRSKQLAQELAGRFRKYNVQPKVVALDQYRLNNLAKEEFFFTIMSTQGEGEPPAAARKFFDYIHSNSLDLSPLRYGVLALGDTSYPLFCKAGEDVDLQLMKLGASRVVPLVKCDVDYEAAADEWIQSVLSQVASVPASAVMAPQQKRAGKSQATVLTNVVLNDTGSLRETHHIELAVDEALAYEPGDALSMIPVNSQVKVDSVLHRLSIDPSTVIHHRDKELKIVDWLRSQANISALPLRVLKAFAAVVGEEIALDKPSLVDLLKGYPGLSLTAQDLANLLEPMAPRLYSISSSSRSVPGELHITVARCRYTREEEERYGVCSDQLSALKEGDGFEFRIHQNLRFRLPQDDATDVIMIGPGTGIAPFRGFLQEREARGASGKNWLFFGEQHFQLDFYYQTELQEWLASGLLTKLSLAFSRDQDRKIYVQHRLWEQSAELFNWLKSGASLYLCGSERPMSEDVEEVLRIIFCKEGKMSEREAEQFLESLKESGRYLKDVY